VIVVTLRLTNTGPHIVRTLFDQGRRADAAEQAELLVKNADEITREVVHLLADELRAIGDRRARGRPKRNPTPSVLLRVVLAAGQYRAAVTARLLIDGDVLDADDLASLAWLLGGLSPEGVPDGMLLDEHHRYVAEIFALDLPAASEALRPHGVAFLHGYELLPANVRRQGFRNATLRRIATHWNAPVAALKRKLAQ
jgi:hypothetical protein